jgi:isoaspartyl peptidase/L-asparaginase-like protein (Ntn-hydrolase superfamily)
MPRDLRALPGPHGSILVCHGGAGSGPSASERVLAAARFGFDPLEEEEASPLEAATRAAVRLEDDPGFNAGTGSVVRLDGKTVQMDAAVMDDAAGFAAVAAIEGVKNPVLVARALLDSPHLILAGDGATRFARSLGMPDHDPITPRGLERHRQQLGRIPPTGSSKEWGREDWLRSWNYPAEIPSELRACDTIGAVVREAGGRFACAASSGGFGPMLRGRVGDVAVPGAGCYAGPEGAVCATGDGEGIIRAFISLRVYEWLSKGVSAVEAVERGLGLLPEEVPLGIVAVGRRDAAAGARPSMAWAAIVDGAVHTP